MTERVVVPSRDNGHGRGMYGGESLAPDGGPVFVFNWECPLHGEGNWLDEDDS